MSNHPNRGPQGPHVNPSPAEIKAWREACQLSQTEAAELLMYSLGGYCKMEHGDNRMHPLVWWAFRERGQRLIDMEHDMRGP
jgi:DNA-binding XRE family transcriptional regulator